MAVPGDVVRVSAASATSVVGADLGYTIRGGSITSEVGAVPGNSVRGSGGATSEVGVRQNIYIPYDNVDETASGEPDPEEAEVDVAQDGVEGHDETQDHEHDAAPQRDTWGSYMPYLFTLIGYVVGFGNIWRFPFLVRENGGLVFLIPYTIMLAVVGVPVFFLELAVGQRRRKGILHAWNEMSSTLGGLGMCCGWLCFMIGLYYNTLIAYCISYFVDSFKNPLPWKSCKDVGSQEYQDECTKHLSSKPSKYYYYRGTLDISEGIDHPGQYNWALCGYLIVTWIIIRLFLWKGAKILGHFVYFSAIFPYFTLIIFFAANCLIEPHKGWTGAWRLLKPDWSFLLKPTTWLKAGSQVFFSLGLGLGCLVVFGSYNSARNDCYRDAKTVSLIDFVTSVSAVLVVFPMIGGLGYRNYETCFRDMKEIFPTMTATVTDHYDIYFVTEAATWKDISSAKPVKIRYAYGEMSDEEKKNFDSRRTGENIQTIVEVATAYKESKLDFLKTVRDCSIGKEATASGAGSGFVFMGFTEAVTQMPGSNLWSVLFFIMLFFLGIDSGFGTVEGVVAAIQDLTGLSHATSTSIVCSVMMTLDLLIFPFGWGKYVMDLMDEYTANWTLLAVALFECISVGWAYGLAKFAYDVHLMTGSKPNLYILLCTKYITPAVLLILLGGSVLQFITSPGSTDYKIFAPKDLKSVGGELLEPLPFYCLATGFSLMFFCMMWIPMRAITRKCKFRLLSPHGPSDFPEEELREERNINVDREEDQFTDAEKAVMGQRSLRRLQKHRDKSKAALLKKRASKIPKSLA